MYRIAVCDDVDSIREQLCTLCAEILRERGLPCETVPFAAAEAFEAARAQEPPFDLLILDIEMGGKSGLALARELRANRDRIAIIFVSGHEGYLREGYDVQPLHFLLKPVERPALERALTVALELREHAPQLVLKSGSRTFTLRYDEIRYLEVLNHELRIHTADGTLSFRHALSEVEALLPPNRFCRCHNSFIINLHCIKEISRNDVTLQGGVCLPIGRRYYERLQRTFIQYLNA